MTLTFRAAFFLILSLLIVWFLYLERAILTPFILALIFAYILNPVINFLSEKIRLPRGLSIIFIYLIVISSLGYLAVIVVTRAIAESQELAATSKVFLKSSEEQIAVWPPLLQEAVREPLHYLQTQIVRPQNFWPFFSGALSGVLSSLIFLISAFFFLKEGAKTVDRLSLLISARYRIEVDILRRQINATLGRYLRGQVLLIMLMATIAFIGFSILGVRFSLLLALLIGLAEVVPFFGPLFAGTIAVLFTIFDGVSRFDLTPFQAGLIVALGYFILNQIENYLVVPNVMGKITRLHPLIILFSVLAGGHLFGILGIVLAVPIAATLRILLRYSLDKLAKK